VIPKLYSELAAWWLLMSAPENYAEEAAFYRETLVAACRRPLRTVLELGSGGGNNASYLKSHFQMTLVDLSPGQYEVFVATKAG
jgi:cyclopropane fatty-acyl-phospholipid synthase-like methyltransferase